MSVLQGHPDDGVLMAFRDGELTTDERRSVQDHLNTCEACSARRHRMEGDAARIRQTLSMLGPTSLEASDPRRVLAQIRHTDTQRKGLSMFDKIRSSKQTQRMLAGALALIVVIGLFTLAPIRALASDFLGLFRVQKFVVVDIDPERMEALMEAMESIQPGEVATIDPEEATEVATLDEAAGISGFYPRSPEGYGDPDSILVKDSETVEFVPDVESLRQVYSMMNLDPMLLPDNIDGKTFTLTFPTGVAQLWEDEAGEPTFTVLQMPSPSVEGPEDVDIEQLGSAMLQLLGMSEEEAERLSADIDWTSTMVLPLPTDLASVREVEVDGTTGLLFDAEGRVEEGGHEIEATGGALLWQKDGMIYVVAAQQLNNIQMQEVAESLR